MQVTESERKYPNTSTGNCNECPNGDPHEGYTISKAWYWYSGNLNREAKSGWYSKDDYNTITQDWEHGLLSFCNFQIEQLPLSRVFHIPVFFSISTTAEGAIFFFSGSHECILIDKCFITRSNIPR